MIHPKISVIVPVYNVEPYISKCIESIQQQSFTDFELLLIDDGTPDKSGQICDDYAVDDVRIRVFHKENGGVSSARNLGIEKALGEWVAFVDSDDYVDTAYLSDMISCVTKDSTLVLAPYDGNACEGIIVQQKEVSGPDMVKYVINHKLLALSAPYGKLFNRKILIERHIQYPEGIHMGEDGIFVIKYLNAVDTLVVTDKKNYHVTPVAGSLSSNYYSFESEWNCYLIWKAEINRFLSRFGKLYDNQLKVLWENRIGNTFTRCLQCVYRQKKKLTLKQQVAYLKSIPLEDIAEYDRYFHPQMLRRRFLKYLIVHRFLYLYVLAGLFDPKK